MSSSTPPLTEPLLSFCALRADTNAQIKAYIFDVVRSAVPKLNLDDVFVSKVEIAGETAHCGVLDWTPVTWGPIDRSTDRLSQPEEPCRERACTCRCNAGEVKNELQKAMSDFGYHILQTLVTDIDPETR